MGLMRFLKSLVGRDPDIFDEQGRVRHLLPVEKWRAWESRFHENPVYDFRQHTGRTSKNPSHDKKLRK